MWSLLGEECTVSPMCRLMCAKARLRFSVCEGRVRKARSSRRRRRGRRATGDAARRLAGPSGPPPPARARPPRSTRRPRRRDARCALWLFWLYAGAVRSHTLKRKKGRLVALPGLHGFGGPRRGGFAMELSSGLVVGWGAGGAGRHRRGVPVRCCTRCDNDDEAWHWAAGPALSSAQHQHGGNGLLTLTAAAALQGRPPAL